MKWRIVQGNKGYKIVSYNNTSLVLSTYSTAATEGQKLVLNTYVNNTDYKDEGFPAIIQYSAAVYNYYDMGYCVRYGETEAVSVSKIDSYMKAISEQYLLLLGLEIIAPTVICPECKLEIYEHLKLHHYAK